MSSWLYCSPSFLVSSCSSFSPTENPSTKPGRAGHMLSTWPCLFPTPGLCSGCSACLEWLSPNISSACNPCSGKAWRTECKGPENVQHHGIWSQCSDVTLSKLDVVLQGSTSQRENPAPETGTFLIDTRLFAFQKDSKWIRLGFKVFALGLSNRLGVVDSIETWNFGMLCLEGYSEVLSF